MDDEQLIALYLNRDEGAIAETQEAFGTRLRQLAFRLLGNSEDVEECLNDTYFKVWNAIPPHRPNNLYAFCVTICRRTAMDMLDKRTAGKRSAQVVELSKEMEECLPAKEREEDEDALAELMNAFLEKLDKEKRVLFIRRYWFGETSAEIAKQYGYSETKVRSVLFRTRKKLQKFLNGKGVHL